jgi:hypothetical protein
LVDAAPRPNADEFIFEEEGDIVNVMDIQNLRVSPMDDVNWGIALMRFPARLSGTATNQNVTLLVYGDVELQNAVPLSTEIEIRVKATASINIRQEPSIAAPVVGRMVPAEAISANGRLEDNSWIRVELPDNGGVGWVFGELIASDVSLADLPVVQPNLSRYAPMQAFYFKSGMNDSMCAEAPNSGILIQTPEGAGRITLLINEVNVEIGSTVLFQAQPGQAMTVSVVEGSARVEAMGVAQKAYAGSEISVPINEEFQPAAPPEEPQPYDMGAVETVPVDLMEREITVHPPLSQGEIDTLSAEFQEEEAAATETPEDQSNATDDGDKIKDDKDKGTPPGLDDNPALGDEGPPGQGETPPGKDKKTEVAPPEEGGTDPPPEVTPTPTDAKDKEPPPGHVKKTLTTTPIPGDFVVSPVPGTAIPDGGKDKDTPPGQVKKTPVVTPEKLDPTATPVPATPTPA